MLLLLLVSACWCAQALDISAKYYAPEDADKYFADFMAKYDKQYVNEEEKAARFEIFKINLEKANRLNNESRTVFGITQFMDLSQEEFIKMYTGLSQNINANSVCNLLTDHDIPDSNAPESFDWRTQKVVTPVKRQGFCGSCYAFSAIGNIESQYAMKTGQLLNLSEQQVVDCDKISDGCNGGLAADSFTELIRMGGCMSRADYPYKGWDDTCRFDKSKVVVSVSACHIYNLTSQSTLKQLLHQNGPLCVSIDGAPLQLASGDFIYDSDCSDEVNHAVLLVGYGTENGVDYWIIKNSWGLRFGNQGYFRLERSDNPRGACGMLNDHMATSVL